MGKLVFFEIEEWEKEYIRQSFAGKTLILTDKKAHEETSEEVYDAEVISTFIYSSLSAETLSKFSNLKLIATRSTGYDHIDLQYCKEKGITVVNVPSYGAHTVAEHTFALILAISRKLIPTVDRSRHGNYSLDGLRGFDLAGKTIGVIGAGKIGSKVIKLATAYEMNVLVYTEHEEQDTEAIRHVELDELLASSDIITLHLPHNKNTHHIINRENIKKFKKHPY